MRQNVLAVMLLAFLAFGALPVFSDAPDRAGFDVLTWDTGARASAMGGSVAGLRADLQALAYNPASLYGVPDGRLSFSYQRRFADIQGGMLAASKRAMGYTFGFSLRYANYGEMRRTDALMNDLGHFTPGDFILGLSLSDSLNFGLIWGVTAQYVYSGYDGYTASAACLDLGVQYPVASQAMVLAASVTHLGVALDAFLEDKEKLPVTVRLGVAKQLAHLPLLFHFNLIRYLDHESGHMGGFYWSLGGEFTLSESLFFRWGYHSRGQEQRVVESQSRLAGLSFGLGLALSQLTVDVGYGLYGALGTLPSLTVGYQL